MNRIPRILGGLTAVVTLPLAGCSASFGSTSISPSDLARQTRDAIADASPDAPADLAVTCGEEDIELKNDTVVECELTGETLAGAFPVEVTIHDVEGSNFRLSYQVSETPKSED
jgi:hypothetical protein